MTLKANKARAKGKERTAKLKAKAKETLIHLFLWLSIPLQVGGYTFNALTVHAMAMFGWGSVPQPNARELCSDRMCPI